MANPAFEPTPEQMRQVEAMAGYGLRDSDIAFALGADGIGETTLRKYFRPQLDRGRAIANANIGQSIYEQAVGRKAEVDPQTGQVVREELKPDKSAAIFLAKARLGMSEVQRIEHSGPNGGPMQVTDLDLTVFTDDEFKLFMQLYEKARRRRDDGEGGAAPAEAPV